MSKGTKEVNVIAYGKSRQRQKPQLTREQIRSVRRKKRKRKVLLARFCCAFFICVAVISIGLCIGSLTKQEERGGRGNIAQAMGAILQKEKNWTIEDMFDRLEEEGIRCTQDFLTVNEYSRPGEKLKRVKNIFVHYTANPGTDASQNRSYFENLSETHETSASAHFIIGYEGEIVQCIPLEEIAYAVAGRNADSVSIECCYVDENGKFTEKTYRTLVHFAALLLEKYGLESGDLMRHYDDNGKLCPKYYVENEAEWKQFVADVAECMENTG